MERRLEHCEDEMRGQEAERSAALLLFFLFFAVYLVRCRILSYTTHSPIIISRKCTGNVNFKRAYTTHTNSYNARGASFTFEVKGRPDTLRKNTSAGQKGMRRFGMR